MGFLVPWAWIAIGLTVPLTGTVEDSVGKPVEGATVWLVDPYGKNPGTDVLAEVKTDAEGRFRFSNSKPGHTILTAHDSLHAPGVAAVEVAQGMKPVEIRLEKPSVIQIHIQDTDGNPIAGASVTADTWRGNRSISLTRQVDRHGDFMVNKKANEYFNEPCVEFLEQEDR